jgi:NADH:ubiquinone oxidoreductase subunit 6 (subunit J)
LALLALLTLLGRRRAPAQPRLRLDWVDGALLLVLLLTLGTRAWVVHRFPFPGWTDSLHHTLLTELTASTGRLPTTLEPYFPVPLTLYHRGLYAVSAPVVWLAQVPAHTALLWTAQALNALGALGVYLLLERRMGRVAGLVGALTVGLLSFQPAFYVNWGRFTQVAGQALLPVAWWVTLHALQHWRDKGATRHTWAWVIVAAWLNAGLFLLHYRVAVFYLPWLALGMVESLGPPWTWARLRSLSIAALTVGLLALLLLSPVVGDAVGTYIAERAPMRTATLGDPAQVAAVRSAYFVFPWETFWLLAFRPWLFGLTLVATAIGLLRRNRLVWVALLWALLLFVLGQAYLLRIPLLNVTNLGAVLILYYLPAAIILGAATVELLRLLPEGRRASAQRFVVAGCLVAALIWTPIRARDVEPFRFFVTPADERAMRWIRTHTPPDARFAVNTLFWLPQMPHGTDAGYWLPYLADRQMSAGVMLLNLADRAEIARVVADSQAVVALAQDPTAVNQLTARGITYLYAGALGNFGGPAFDVAQLALQPGIEVVYQDGPVAILHLVAPP